MDSSNRAIILPHRSSIFLPYCASPLIRWEKKNQKNPAFIDFWYESAYFFFSIKSSVLLPIENPISAPFNSLFSICSFRWRRRLCFWDLLAGFSIRSRWDSSVRIPPPSAESALLPPEVGSNLTSSWLQLFLCPIRLSDFVTGISQIGSEGRDGSGNEEKLGGEC